MEEGIKCTSPKPDLLVMELVESVLAAAAVPVQLPAHLSSLPAAQEDDLQAGYGTWDDHPPDRWIQPGVQLRPRRRTLRNVDKLVEVG